ncbi:helix-turn-helix domain-containing protein [Pedobacter petrophilus]|uniref:Helix-turn-helix domain-containing protein n=1 Tax=Pedobacter petrophilus TaxID=1908241 RepID=A0A7K0FWD6_9SPHI|nr:helix-turn-helix transcriptional regulator [Pedobacter petrophilus]MRX75913.1 helix-turn-helix domain-containing protein [Pedobacter petrophilus]
MQIAPSPFLQGIVRHYLVLSSNACSHPDFRIFSDGSPGIVFHRKAPFIQISDKNGCFDVQPNCFVYGQITQFNTISATAEMDMLIIVLQPSALLKLFNIAAFEINDKTIPFADLTGHSGRLLIESVQEQPDNAVAISLIEDFLFNRAIKKTYHDDIVSTSVKQIYAHKGMKGPTKIFKDIPATERQLERKFLEHIGLSPKKFAGIIRLQYFLKCLKTANPTTNISEISYHCGYYDQSQLNNIFKKNTGLTPLQYQANANLLAVNFLLLGS